MENNQMLRNFRDEQEKLAPELVSEVMTEIIEEMASELKEMMEESKYIIDDDMKIILDECMYLAAKSLCSNSTQRTIEVDLHTLVSNSATRCQAPYNEVGLLIERVFKQPKKVPGIGEVKLSGEVLEIAPCPEIEVVCAIFREEELIFKNREV